MLPTLRLSSATLHAHPLRRDDSRPCARVRQRPRSDEVWIWRPPALAAHIVSGADATGSRTVGEARLEGESLVPPVQQVAPVALPRVNVQVCMGKRLPACRDHAHGLVVIG